MAKLLAGLSRQQPGLRLVGLKTLEVEAVGVSATAEAGGLYRHGIELVLEGSYAAFANYLERVLNSQMEGITIEVEAGRGTGDAAGTVDYRDTKIAIGKYVSQGLYVKYKQGLSITSAMQIEVEYRISNLFLIRSEVLRYSEKAIQGNSPRTTEEINVDLKLRWEY